MSERIRTYRDLMVWQKSMALVTEVYRLTQSFPKEEMYGLTSQMRRCAVSVPSNIAEGYGRQGAPSFQGRGTDQCTERSRSSNQSPTLESMGHPRFLRMAMGSLYELQTQMEIAGNLGYADPSSPEPLVESAREIERMMSSLIRRLNDKPVEESTR